MAKGQTLTTRSSIWAADLHEFSRIKSGGSSVARTALVKASAETMTPS